MDVQQIAAVGLQRVSDIAECSAVGEDDLPVGAGAREQRPVNLGAGECPTVWGTMRRRPDALGAQPDQQYLQSAPAPVLNAVTWGRPIANKPSEAE